MCNGGFDDSSATSNHSLSSDCIQLAACEVGELLPMNPELPADIFTSCLTTPIKVALRWFVTIMFTATDCVQFPCINLSHFVIDLTFLDYPPVISFVTVMTCLR